MSYRLFIDDERFPPDGKGHWEIARNEAEVASLLSRKGAPTFISFDHDLGENELTGHDIARRLVAGDLGEMENTPYAEGLPLDFSFTVHSQNPIGAANIQKLLERYLEFKRSEI